MSGTIDVGALQLWLATISSVVALAATLWSILSSGTRKNAKNIVVLEKRVEDIERRMENVPSMQGLHDLHISLTEVKGELSKIDAVINGHVTLMRRLESVVTRQEEFLLTRGGQ